MDLTVVLPYNLNLPLAHQRDRLLPVDDFERLVRRVQEERLFHSQSNFARALARCQDNDTVNVSKHGELAALYRPRPVADRCGVGESRNTIRAVGGVLAVTPLCTACASPGAPPRPFPTPGGFPASPAHPADPPLPAPPPQLFDGYALVW